jgi:hypothetical protein
LYFSINNKSWLQLSQLLAERLQKSLVTRWANCVRLTTFFKAIVRRGALEF